MKSTTQPAAPPVAEPPTGFYLPCPSCGDEEAAMRLHLDEPGVLTCHACDNEVTTEKVRTLIAKWAPVLAWIDAMPKPDA